MRLGFAIKLNPLHRNGASPIVMRGVQKCTGAGASLRDRNVQPLCCINLDTVTDPACGSGGMFVQTAHYIERHRAKGKQINLRAYGVEKTGATVKLAKMNLVLNNVRGTITEANSYYRDPCQAFED